MRACADGSIIDTSKLAAQFQSADKLEFIGRAQATANAERTTNYEVVEENEVLHVPGMEVKKELHLKAEYLPENKPSYQGPLLGPTRRNQF